MVAADPGAVAVVMGAGAVARAAAMAEAVRAVARAAATVVAVTAVARVAAATEAVGVVDARVVARAAGKHSRIVCLPARCGEPRCCRTSRLLSCNRARSRM